MADFEPREFLELASKIAEDYSNPTAYRTAIGRAYYACFLTGRDALMKKGWLTPSQKADDHSLVRRVLHDHGQNRVGQKLRGLVEMREHADYHTTQDVSCPYCQKDESESWLRARQIADDILPTLASISPTR